MQEALYVGLAECLTWKIRMRRDLITEGLCSVLLILNPVYFAANDGYSS